MVLQISRIVFISLFHIVLWNYGNGQILSPIQGNPYWPLDKQFYDNTAQLEHKFSQWSHLPKNLQQVRQQNQLQWRQSQVLWRQKYAGWMERFALWQQDLQQLQQALGFGQFKLPISPKLQASTQKNAQKWAAKKQSRMFRQSQLNNLHQLYISQPQTGYTTKQLYEFTKDVADHASDRFEDSADYFVDQLKLFARGVKEVACNFDDAFKYTGPVIQVFQNQLLWQQNYALWKQKYAGWLQDFTASWQKDLQELQQSVIAAKGYIPSSSKANNKHAAKQLSTKFKDVADYFEGELEIFEDGIKEVADDIGDAIELRFKDKFKFVPGQFYNIQAVNGLGGSEFLQQPLPQQLPQQLPAVQKQHLQLPEHQPILQAIFQQQPPTAQPALLPQQQQQQQIPSFYRCRSLECEQKAFDKIPKFYNCADVECERKAFQAQMQRLLRF